MMLSKHTLSALEHKAQVACDTLGQLEGEQPTDKDPTEEIVQWREDVQSWVKVQGECVSVLAVRSVKSLAAFPLAMGELDNHLGSDTTKAEWEAITADLCRAGHYEVHDPASVCTARPTLRTVDGVRYEVGRPAR